MQYAAPARSLRHFGWVLSVAALTCAPGVPARADHAPAFVLPNPRGIPLTVDGVEVSGAVIEGDWGLYRPGHGTVTVYPGVIPIAPPAAAYFPVTGDPPLYGRSEIETPDDRRPRRAQPYFRRWTSEGAGEGSAYDPPLDPPLVIEAPRYRKPRHGERRRDR